MHDPEHLEKMRQAVMRLRELLDIMRQEVAAGEQAYSQLFASLEPEELANLPEKERQGLAAELLLDDPSPLAKTALHLRFIARNLERDFEQLHDHVAPD